MFFGKKKEAKGVVPVDKIKAMQHKGMSDRDIIKSLKDDGYDYDSIEKGMLQSVKEGVTPETHLPQRTEHLPAPEHVEELPADTLPTAEDIMKPASVKTIENHQFDSESRHREELNNFEDDLSPELVIEELVEGVIDEKWNKIQKKLKFVDDEMERIRMTLHQLKKKPVSESKLPEGAMDEVHDKIDDLDARIGGLEKAFKQFLPSLTRNIENLSRIIDEMKKK